MAGIAAGLCSGEPSKDDILRLPPRIRAMFLAWLQREVMSPEAAPGGGSSAGEDPAVRSRRVILYAVRRWLHFTPDEWDALSWDLREMYLDGLSNEEGIPFHDPAGQRAGGGRGAAGQEGGRRGRGDRPGRDEAGAGGEPGSEAADVREVTVDGV